MREITLNGRQEKIVGEIDQRPINPFKSKLGATGSGLEYSDFSQASMEEYHDFRSGIGKNRALGSEARLEFSQGIDFAIEGQATLGPLVTTAGSFGVAPVKIIDFQGLTFAIGHNQISEWNVGGSSWTSRDTSLANPIDALVVTDSTDEYLIVSSATSAIYTTDGTTWTALEEWKTPDSTNDPSNAWSNDANAIDDDTGTYADDPVAVNVYTEFLEVLLTASLFTDTIRVWAKGDGDGSGVLTADIDFYYNDAWNDVFEGTITIGAWVTVTHTSQQLVSKARVRFKQSSSGNGARLYEFDFQAQFMGYLADFENRLYGITTDGRIVLRSVTKNIDSYSGFFSLTGNFGTVYDLFEGKLLADGTPTLYFTGTEGLFSLDTTNEIAYKQEVAYPNLTNAGNVGIYWNANVWVATGYGIIKVAPSIATYVGPDQDDGLPATYQGKIYDFATVNNWLIFCVNGGSTDKSSILKRNSSLGGNLQVYTTSATNKPIACMHHSPSSLYTNGRLWFGEDTSVKYMMMPDTTSNVKQISTYEYVDDSGFGTFPIFRKLAVISKTALGVAAITKSCDATEKIEVYYGLDGAAATTLLGTFTASPHPTTLTFNSGLGTTFYTIQFAIKLYRDATNTNSPELESLMFYWYPTPSIINGWIFRIEATDDTSDEIITRLEAIRDTNTLVVFYPSGDTSKKSYNVKLTNMPLRFWHEEQKGREGYVQVVLEQIFEG